MVKKTRRVSTGKLKKARRSRLSKDGSKTKTTTKTTKEGGSQRTTKKVENVKDDEPGYMKQTISSKNK